MLWMIIASKCRSGQEGSSRRRSSTRRAGRPATAGGDGQDGYRCSPDHPSAPEGEDGVQVHKMYMQTLTSRGAHSVLQKKRKWPRKGRRAAKAERGCQDAAVGRQHPRPKTIQATKHAPSSPHTPRTRSPNNDDSKKGRIEQGTSPIPAESPYFPRAYRNRHSRARPRPSWTYRSSRAA